MLEKHVFKQITCTGYSPKRSTKMSSQQHEKKLTRRQFAQAAATAGLALASINSASASVKNAKVLKVGLLGCGGRGTGALFNMLEGNDRGKSDRLGRHFRRPSHGCFGQVI